ncbi:transcription factor GTE10-like isoform X2 [Corylus avellana]|uniref:transcription factor GTE10-like isoform X2 n=1 Tax=Corylus avellana TaxID=13451 RepID=UPI00286D599B|nr:transcription factor GTE10-like isoform X2 [Corylus avellana]
MAPTVPIDFTGQKESRKCMLSQMMGKSRKYSKGHSTGFVSDYRHAVETMGESEGLGSSGRVETEMTVSEDSYAPKRKCISLNTDGYDGFVVPMQVLSFSKMSRSERKDLELRLKMELEQVRTLQRKVDSLSSNVVVLSPSSDIRSCSDGKKRPPLESFQRSSEVLAPLGKRKAPVARNGSRAKKSSSGRFEPTKLAAVVSTSNALLMEKCKMLLENMRSHQFGWVFNEPVDVVKLNIPDYFTVIKHPMDLGTVRSKMTSGEYASPMEFAADVRLTFANAMTYNPPGNDVHFMAKTLGKYFEARMKAIEKKLPVTTDEQSVPSRAGDHIESEITMQIPPAKRKKTIPRDDASVKPEPVRQIMTGEERLKLSTELEALLGELPESIVDFLKEQSAGQANEEEIEIDIGALSDDTLFKLRKLLDDYMLARQINQEKAEPCEIELLNESGVSNSSMQLCNDQVDEDVDIVGGNDPPVSSYPPVEIEKDAANRNSKCSSPSSSSSESGSSSSDSDSGSSSRSESVAAKASVPVTAVKENLGSVANLDQKKSDLGDSEVENTSIDGVGLVEQDSQSKPISAEADGRQEAESAPSERQVSPDKLYRAALLRSRFADTILKAQKKALEKGEKGDPEKLRLEREELERKQKQEKARLQAEAKAAEEFRRKAEAEAAAEIKRQRELEREAARQALLKMEKTVDINENSQFLEHLPSFTEETIPDVCQDGFGSFTLQGTSNPLEQLGLYMKADDEEDEEEVEPLESAPEPAIDVEEGEID